MKELSAHLAALFTVIIWGATFISTKLLLVDLSAEEILFLRFTLGWLALWIFAPVWLPFQDWKNELLFIGAGCTGVTLYFLLENIALEYTYASNVSVIVSTTPFFTALVGWLLFQGRRPGWRFYAGFLLAICGIGMISFNENNIDVSPLGDLLSLLASLAWAFYSELTKKITALNLGSLRSTRRIFFYGLLLMAPVMLVNSAHLDSALLLKPANLFNLIFLGLFASAICFATWTFCLLRLGSARASAYIYLVPVVTVITASIWLNERLGFWPIIGIGLTIAGLILSEYRHNSSHIS